MSAFVVGLTGGIASGKTAVSQRFEALGITVADADAAARDAVAIGSDGLADVVDMFGAGVLAADGSYKMKWVDFANATDTPSFDGFQLSLIWKF